MWHRLTFLGLFVSGASMSFWKWNSSIASASNSLLTPSQIEFFKKNGFIILPNFFTQKECEDIKQEMDSLIRNQTINSSIPPEKVLTIVQPQGYSSKIRDYMLHPKIGNTLKDLVGSHLAPGFWDGHVKALQCMLFTKPPSFPGQAWHQDELYLPTRDRSLTAIWIPLEDSTIQNGTLWVVPQSHLPGILYPTRPHNNPEFEWDDESYGFDDSEAIPVEMKAGSALLFNGYLVHRSLKNRSDKSRKVFTCHYASMNTLFPWKTPASNHATYLGTVDDRGVFPLVGSDPYSYKGYVHPQLHWRYMDSEGKIQSNYLTKELQANSK